MAVNVNNQHSLRFEKQGNLVKACFHYTCTGDNTGGAVGMYLGNILSEQLEKHYCWSLSKVIATTTDENCTTFHFFIHYKSFKNQGDHNHYSLKTAIDYYLPLFEGYNSKILAPMELLGIITNHDDIWLEFDVNTNTKEYTSYFELIGTPIYREITPSQKVY